MLHLLATKHESFIEKDFATFVSYSIALFFLFLRWCTNVAFTTVDTCGIHNGVHMMWHSQLCCHDFSLRLKIFITYMFCTQSPVIFIVASYNLSHMEYVLLLLFRNILFNTELLLILLLVLIYNFPKLFHIEQMSPPMSHSLYLVFIYI